MDETKTRRFAPLVVFCGALLTLSINCSASAIVEVTDPATGQPEDQQFVCQELRPAAKPPVQVNKLDMPTHYVGLGYSRTVDILTFPVRHPVKYLSNCTFPCRHPLVSLYRAGKAVEPYQPIVNFTGAIGGAFTPGAALLGGTFKR